MIDAFLKKLIADGWTQQQIAEKAGTTQQTVSKCLQGKQCTVETLIKIAKAFNATTDEVLGLDPPPEDPPKKKTSGYNSYSLKNI